MIGSKKKQKTFPTTTEKQKSSETKVEKKSDGTIVRTVTKTVSYKKLPKDPNEVKKEARVKYFMLFAVVMIKVLTGVSTVYQIKDLYKKIQQDVPSKNESEELISRMKNIARVVMSKHLADTASIAAHILVMKDLIKKSFLIMQNRKKVNKNQAKLLAEEAVIEGAMNVAFAFMSKMISKIQEKQQLKI